MTCSFHKHGDFFPGTGDIKDIGTQDGKYFSVNVPLDEGKFNIKRQIEFHLMCN